MPNIEVKNLTVEYDLRTVALSCVDLSLPTATVTTIVGTIGAGKTTLLYALGGLVDVTSGEITFGGVRVDGKSARERNVCLVGRLPEPRRTVGAVLEYGMKLRGESKAERRRKLVQASEVFALNVTAKVSNLTPLERRKLGLARAYVREPDLLLLDEPFIDLTDVEKVELAENVAYLTARGITCLATSSAGEDAYVLGNRVVVLSNGKIVIDGEREQITAHPKTRFVASYVGEEVMSFVSDEGGSRGFYPQSAVQGTGYNGVVEGEGDGYLSVRIERGMPPVRLLASNFPEVAVGEELTFALSSFVSFDEAGNEIAQPLKTPSTKIAE